MRGAGDRVAGVAHEYDFAVVWACLEQAVEVVESGVTLPQLDPYDRQVVETVGTVWREPYGIHEGLGCLV